MAELFIGLRVRVSREVIAELAGEDSEETAVLVLERVAREAVMERIEDAKTMIQGRKEGQI